MSRSRRLRPRRNALLWIFATVFFALFVFFLFWAEPLFLGKIGAKAHLQERAKRLRSASPKDAAVAIGRMVKVFLDGSKHASGVEVILEESSARRIVYSLILPWTEKSEKLHRRRGRTTAQLTASLLKSANFGQVGVVVNVNRRRLSSNENEPAGRAVFDPIQGTVEWKPSEDGGQVP